MIQFPHHENFRKTDHFWHKCKLKKSHAHVLQKIQVFGKKKQLKKSKHSPKCLANWIC